MSGPLSLWASATTSHLSLHHAENLWSEVRLDEHDLKETFQDHFVRANYFEYNGERTLHLDTLCVKIDAAGMFRKTTSDRLEQLENEYEEWLAKHPDFCDDDDI